MVRFHEFCFDSTFMYEIHVSLQSLREKIHLSFSKCCKWFHMLFASICKHFGHNNTQFLITQLFRTMNKWAWNFMNCNEYLRLRIDSSHELLYSLFTTKSSIITLRWSASLFVTTHIDSHFFKQITLMSTNCLIIIR